MLSIFLFLAQVAFSAPAPRFGPIDYGSRVAQAIDTLQATWYNRSSGIWDNLWWNSANCLTTIAKYHSTNPSSTSLTDILNPIYETSFKGGLAVAQPDMGKQPGSWLNSLYDDEGWWALAWIQVYDVTGNEDYLSAAQDIFTDMHNGLNRTSCGGLVWARNTDLLSSIENSLYLDLAAKLAVRVPNHPTYLPAALTQYHWLTEQTPLLPSTNLVPDGLNPSDCTASIPRILTYNQGALLGALLSLHHAHPENSTTYLSRALALANATISHPELTPAGILTEDCDPVCDTTAAQFKGIFLRHLAALHRVDPADDLRAFIRRNADSVWTRARGDGNKLGSAWAGPFRDAQLSAMCSGLDALVAAEMVGRE